MSRLFFEFCSSTAFFFLGDYLFNFLSSGYVLNAYLLESFLRTVMNNSDNFNFLIFEESGRLFNLRFVNICLILPPAFFF